MGSKFSCMIKEAKVLGMALGIPCFRWVMSTDKDGCFTSDSDIFLFGARTMYRDICLGDGSYVTCYEMTEVERRLGFGRNSLEVSIIHKGLLLNILFNVPNFSRYALSFLSDLLRKQVLHSFPCSYFMPYMLMHTYIKCKNLYKHIVDFGCLK